MTDVTPRVPLLPRAPWLYRLGVLLVAPFVRLVYGLRVHGVEHVPLEGPCVIAANHDSAWDPPVVGISTPRFLQFMAKRELFERRLVGAVFRGVGSFPVNRGQNDIGAVKEALRRLRAGGAVGIFFEGTRHAEAKASMDGAAFLAQRSGAALVPTAIWREGRRFHVAFGAAITLTSAGRDATSAVTSELTERVRELLATRGAALRDDA